ncbi:hypothetical protein BaRGS_00024560, partial [Batillaria attramentaria]
MQRPTDEGGSFKRGRGLRAAADDNKTAAAYAPHWAWLEEQRAWELPRGINILKFSDDTTVQGLITNSDESEYRDQCRPSQISWDLVTFKAATAKHGPAESFIPS